jgi:hypothetical protein
MPQEIILQKAPGVAQFVRRLAGAEFAGWMREEREFCG